MDEKEMKWIDIKHKKIPCNTQVLVFYKNEIYLASMVSESSKYVEAGNEKGCCYDGDPDFLEIELISHWMPLSPP